MTTATHKVLLLDAFIEQAVAQWRTYRVEHPYLHTGNLDDADADAMDAIVEGIAPTDRATLLAMAANDRVWADTTSPEAEVPLGECVESGVRWALMHAMWATDRVS